MKPPDNPMHPAQRLSDAPRCKVMAKTTRCRCKGPAVKGWSVCRMHGAKGGGHHLALQMAGGVTATERGKQRRCAAHCPNLWQTPSGLRCS